MFEDDRKLFCFRGLGGIQVTVGYSILLLIGLYASLSLSANPDGLLVAMIVLGSSLLAGFARAAAAIVQGVGITGISIGGSGVDLNRSNTAPAADEFLISSAVPLTYLALFGFLGLASNVVADHANSIALATGHAEMNLSWRRVVDVIWLAATVNFFLCILHLLPAYPFTGGMLFHKTLLILLPEHRANMVSGFMGLMMFVIWIPLSLAFLSVGQGVFLIAPAWHRHMALLNNQRSI